MRKLSTIAAAGLMVMSVSAGGAQTPPAPTSQTPQIDCNWLSVDTTIKTATFEVIGGHTGLNGGLNFNGYNDGKLTLTVPTNWHVVIRFVNRDANLPHSVEVIDSVRPTPAGPVDPAFARAMSVKLAQGITAGQTDEFRFVASRAGSFWIFCAVPGHGLAGMWIKLRVSPSDKLPTLTATASASGR